MPLSNPSLSYPKPRSSYIKMIALARTNTTAVIGAWLPKDACIVGIYIIGSVASDAGTSAIIDVGTTTTATELVASYDVKTAATGEGYNPVGGAAVGTAMRTKLTVDTPIYVKYTETGTASTAGGPWTVKIEYIVLGPGEGHGD